jgi:hypothetical protein
LGHGPGDLQVCVAERLIAVTVKVERADDVRVRFHRHRAQGMESCLRGSRCEDGPPGVTFRAACLHGVADAERVHARALRALDLEQLQQPHPLLRGGHEPQFTARVD